MFLDTNKIGPEGLSFDHRLELRDLRDEDAAAMSVRNVRVWGRVTRSAQHASLSARLEATVRRTCGRCLERFELAVAGEFALKLVRNDPQGVGAPDDADDLFYAPEGIADLDLMASEQIYLRLPMKAVCREGCRGLCPSCGANLNDRECGCREDDVDPRLAPLLDLRNRISN